MLASVWVFRRLATSGFVVLWDVGFIVFIIGLEAVAV